MIKDKSHPQGWPHDRRYYISLKRQFDIMSIQRISTCNYILCDYREKSNKIFINFFEIRHITHIQKSLSQVSKRKEFHLFHYKNNLFHQAHSYRLPLRSRLFAASASVFCT